MKLHNIAESEYEGLEDADDVLTDAEMGAWDIKAELDEEWDEAENSKNMTSTHPVDVLLNAIRHLEHNKQRGAATWMACAIMRSTLADSEWAGREVFISASE